MTFSAALDQALTGQAAAGVPNGMGMGMMEDDEEDEDDEDDEEDDEDDKEDEEGGQQTHLPGSTCAPPVSPARVLLASCTGSCSETVLHVHPALQIIELRLYHGLYR